MVFVRYSMLSSLADSGSYHNNNFRPYPGDYSPNDLESSGVRHNSTLPDENSRDGFAFFFEISREYVSHDARGSSYANPPLNNQIRLITFHSEESRDLLRRCADYSPDIQTFKWLKAFRIIRFAGTSYQSAFFERVLRTPCRDLLQIWAVHMSFLGKG